MKTIELSVIGREDDRSVRYYRNNELVGWLSDSCGISDNEIILIGKKGFEELLANQRKPERQDLALGTMVMVFDRLKNSCWWLAKYAGRGGVKMVNGHSTITGDDHIIPYSLFDPDNPDKWNGTENDYGLKGGAR